jgi:Magnesium chelatase, subunit ChlI
MYRRSDPNLLLLDPPGTSKSMLARRLTTMLPTMTFAEALETTRFRSVAGRIGVACLEVFVFSVRRGFLNPMEEGPAMPPNDTPESAPPAPEATQPPAGMPTLVSPTSAP